MNILLGILVLLGCISFLQTLDLSWSDLCWGLVGVLAFIVLPAGLVIWQLGH